MIWCVEVSSCSGMLLGGKEKVEPGMMCSTAFERLSSGCAGFLPFSAIYIELYYIFASVWGHKVYTIYSILFIVFIILIIVTAFITIALTYFQLAVEDHRWWWRSFLCGGSTGKHLPPPLLSPFSNPLQRMRFLSSREYRMVSWLLQKSNEIGPQTVV